MKRSKIRSFGSLVQKHVYWDGSMIYKTKLTWCIVWGILYFWKTGVRTIGGEISKANSGFKTKVWLGREDVFEISSVLSYGAETERQAGFNCCTSVYLL